MAGGSRSSQHMSPAATPAPEHQMTGSTVRGRSRGSQGSRLPVYT